MLTTNTEQHSILNIEPVVPNEHGDMFACFILGIAIVMLFILSWRAARDLQTKLTELRAHGHPRSSSTLRKLNETP